MIAGKGEDIDKYKQKVKFKDNIIFENKRIGNDEVGIFFDTASIVVLPYLEATQSGVIPLAFAYSKPVVATDVGSLSEVVIDKYNGMLIEPNSVDSLVKGILFLIKNENIRKEMGRNANNFAMNELSWDLIAQNTIKVYNSIMKSH